MSTLDWIIIGIAACGLGLGYMRGFMAQLVSAAGFFAAYLIAFLFYRKLAPYILTWLGSGKFENYPKYQFLVKGLHLDVYVSNAVAFALLFFGVKLAFIVVSGALNIVVKVPGLSTVNRWAGALLGLAEAMVILFVGLHLLTIMPSDPIQKALTKSVIAPHMLQDWPVISKGFERLWENAGTKRV